MLPILAEAGTDGQVWLVVGPIATCDPKKKAGHQHQHHQSTVESLVGGVCVCVSEHKPFGVSRDWPCIAKSLLIRTL